ncbi:hybrid sensor histidine kinase/response regulator [Leptothermofonsia sp. ETS-13]|uniref:hybrid sensor histidine kinase/response regulator n=1 Tax=Leptothermofonsia sp. ETS-13 TaxID=3035696 RepID=UPI003BA06BD6
MAYDKEREIRRQFLDEAQAYLDTLDAAVLGIAAQRVEGAKINGALRATHSIKGGAALMGFELLSQLAHRLEDAFKVLKLQRELVVDATLETLLLSAVKCLHQVIQVARQNGEVEASWLAAEVNPTFDQLHALLGDPKEEDAQSVLSPEEGQDVIPLLFETEVEGCLQRLAAVLESPSQPCLREEVTILAQELAGLGEMLQLEAFTRLCHSVTDHLEAHPEQVEAIARSALNAWRQTQTLVMAGQLDGLPTEITLSPAEETGVAQSFDEVDQEVETLIAETVTTISPPQSPAFIPPQKQPTVQQRATVGESQVTDFKILETNTSSSTAAEEDQDATVRVSVRQLNRLNDLFGELTIERNGLDLYLNRLRNLVITLNHRLKTLEQTNAQMRTVYDTASRRSKPSVPLLMGTAVHSSASDFTSSDTPDNRFDALELDSYSELHLLWQEVMETIVQVQEVSSDIDLSLEEAQLTSRNLSKTAKHLQSHLTQIRMRPLSDIVDRFPRALRELSLQYDKPVRLHLIGSSTLIDRTILEHLHDPLLHLLRNAFDHGIEERQTRQQRGKPEEGLIEIRAAHRGNRTLITVRDDGGGIPLDKVRQRAQQMGLDPTLLATASDAELLTLIFEPGFSTTEQVTPLSGRGVGMDVVREHLRRVRGEITVNTQAGIGTTFTLSVPLTLSIVRVLLVESNGLLLAFPSDAVQELFLLDPEALMTTAGTEVLAYQQSLLQVVRLSRWLVFHCPRQPHNLEAPPTINAPAVLVVQPAIQPMGLVVDRSWGEQEVAIRRVEGPLSLPPGFNNCIILGDGRAVPLVNVADLLHWITSVERSTPPLSPAPSLAAASIATEAGCLPPSRQETLAKPTILIVDDSIHVRRFLALTLERAGYRVEQAKDGLDALEQLHAGGEVQAVICDIEMPRLDGFGFLARLKADSQRAKIPVVMLTSRSGPKHRQLALNLGAAAYFSKPYNEQILLRSLEQLIHSYVPTH